MGVRIDRSLPGDIPPGGTMGRTEDRIGPIPVVERDLIDHLRSRFPVNVTRGRDPRDYDILVGQQEVIEYLSRLWKEQNS